MKPIQKIELLESLGTELQSRMTFSDIDIFLAAHNVNLKNTHGSYNSKRVYVKEVLATVDEQLLLTLAEELEIDHKFSTIKPKEATFWKVGYFRLFLSHLASFKGQASKLQSVLKKYGISSFVAHEDIQPSREWQVEIEAGLHTMDAFVALLIPGFKDSEWCDQEIGIAVARDVLIVPVRKGLDPYGFIGKFQGIQAQNKTVGDVAEEIFYTIVQSTKTRTKMLRSLSNAISQNTDEAQALESLLVLTEQENIPTEILVMLKDAVEENTVLVNSKKFVKKLNILFSKYAVSKIGNTPSIEPEEWGEIPF